MTNSTAASTPFWLRVLQFPLTRIAALGGTIFYMLMMNNTNLLTFKDDPAMAIANTIGMGVLAMIVYAAWGRFIERAR